MSQGQAPPGWPSAPATGEAPFGPGLTVPGASPDSAFPAVAAVDTSGFTPASAAYEAAPMQLAVTAPAGQTAYGGGMAPLAPPLAAGPTINDPGPAMTAPLGPAIPAAPVGAHRRAPSRVPLLLGVLGATVVVMGIATFVLMRQRASDAADDTATPIALSADAKAKKKKKTPAEKAAAPTPPPPETEAPPDPPPPPPATNAGPGGAGGPAQTSSGGGTGGGKTGGTSATSSNTSSVLHRPNHTSGGSGTSTAPTGTSTGPLHKKRTPRAN